MARTSNPALGKKRSSPTNEDPAHETSHSAPTKRRRQIVNKHRDGLIDLTDPSPDILAISKRNAITSPLLSLPGEIRTKIWEYAVTYDTVVAIPPLARESWSVGQYHPMNSHPCLAYFTLLQASRQIYAEAALLPYKMNTFSVACSIFNVGAPWKLRLSKAQFGVIRSIKRGSIDLWRYYEELRFKIPDVRSRFPNLRRMEFHLTERSMVPLEQARDGTVAPYHDWQTEMTQRIQQFEG